MDHIHDLIHRNGDLFYLITFAWTALEGETFVIFAGLAAQKHMLNVGLLFLAAWLGSMCGDQALFWVGRRYGTRLLERMPRFKPRVERAVRWLESYAILFILSYRFMYGLRNVSGIAVGLSHIPWRKFSIWNAIAAFVWAAAFVGFGYLFGDVIAHMHHKQQVVEESVRQLMLTMLGLFALLISLRLIIIRLRWYRMKKEGHLPGHPHE